MKAPLISICIPAYKNEVYLKRLLDSIGEQTFKDFEVIITDDSDSDAIRLLCAGYLSRFALFYHKNNTALGSPENWNEAIRKANGEWIKIMHDDDWFADRFSLEKFALTAEDAKADFLFSGYYNIDLETGKTSRFIISRFQNFLLRRSPLNLLKRNFIGHPSTTLIRNNSNLVFNKDLKWVVDLEFYIRYLGGNNYFLIKESLINLGISPEQVTATAFRNPKIEIPENISLLKIIRVSSLKNIFVFDYYWRFIRNLSIRSASVIEKYYDQPIPGILLVMIRQQKTFPLFFLQFGFFSKCAMTVFYLVNRVNGRFQ